MENNQKKLQIFVIQKAVGNNEKTVHKTKVSTMNNAKESWRLGYEEIVIRRN